MFLSKIFKNKKLPRLDPLLKEQSKTDIPALIQMGKSDQSLGEGWYDIEYNDNFWGQRWTKKEAYCLLRTDPTVEEKVLGMIAGHPLPQLENPILRIWHKDKLIGEAEILPLYRRYFFPFRDKDEILELKLEVNKVFTTEETGDIRQLGIMVREIGTLGPNALFLPRTVEFETTRKCNINPPCVMCYARIFQDEVWNNAEISEDNLEKMLPVLTNADTLSLHSAGDPMMYSKLWELLEKIDYSRTRISFCTNGVLINKENAERFVRLGVQSLNVSIDAATPKTYKRLRRGDLKRVVENLKYLKEIKKRYGKEYPKIMVSMILMRSNLDEAADFVDLAFEVGAEVVRYSRLNDLPADFPETYQQLSGDFLFDYKREVLPDKACFYEEALKEARKRAKKYGIQFSLSFREIDL